LQSEQLTWEPESNFQDDEQDEINAAYEHYLEKIKKRSKKISVNQLFFEFQHLIFTEHLQDNFFV